ncbi:MAG: hypothetical protein M3N43_07925 [Actinomycetota bacterium]|nr:hypothetical protein [Actinomycetota bacterium]
MPEPIVNHEGPDNNAGERTAANRCMAQWRQAHPHLTCLVTADRLRAQAPPLAVRHAHDRHDLLGVQDGDPAVLCEQVQAAAPAGGVTDAARPDRAAGVVPRWRLVHDGPRHESNPAVQVHGRASWEIGQATGQPCRGVTDRRVSQRHVSRLLRGGRARGTIAHEPFTTRHNQGDHVEHHDGHGAPPLAGGVALVMRLACLGDQTQPRGGAWLQAVWATLGRKRRLRERMRAWCDADALASRRQLCAARLSGVKPSSPLVTMDASASAAIASTTTWPRTR